MNQIQSEYISTIVTAILAGIVRYIEKKKIEKRHKKEIEEIQKYK